MPMVKDNGLPGSIYRNGKRYWWAVQLPGETKRKARPLRPAGARFATTDPGVAEQVAREMYERAKFNLENVDPADRTILGLCRQYLKYAKTYYRDPTGQPTSEVESISRSMELLINFCPQLQAEEFGSLKLMAMREQMIEEIRKSKDGKEDVPRFSRGVINKHINIIRRMFKWASKQHKVPDSTYQSLRAVDGLRRGRSEARETEPVGPIAEHWVRATMRHMPPTIAAMVELQMLGGMRPGEVCQMRAAEIDTSGTIWIYRPRRHKNKWRGQTREIPLGPRAQKILKPFLKRDLNAYLFSPTEANEQRSAAKRAARKSPVQPSQQDRHKDNPANPPGDYYDTRSYYRAIQYAIKAANRAGLMAHKQGTDDVEIIPHWHPHQLRHTAATLIRKELGLDAARALLGQRSLAIADTYAELDQALAIEAAKKLG